MTATHRKLWRDSFVRLLRSFMTTWCC